MILVGAFLLLLFLLLIAAIATLFALGIFTINNKASSSEYTTTSTLKTATSTGLSISTISATSTGFNTFTTTLCNISPNCSYGQMFNAALCNCECDAPNGFSGVFCENVDCSIATDAIECQIIGCPSGQEYSCPFACNLCTTTTDSTTMSTSTETTTTTTTTASIGKIWKQFFFN